MRKLIRFCVRKIPRPVLIMFSGLFSVLVRPFYIGNKVSCPVCGKTFRKFLPYGKDGHDNRMCPCCLSLERHRLMWLYWRDFSDFFVSQKKVLHIAPEQPFIKRFRKNQNFDYTTADLVSPIADLHFDVMNIPLADESYDYIICNHVLEHVESDFTAMKEFYRVLKKGGTAILQVPINQQFETTYEDKSIVTPAEREKHYGQYDHVRWHGKDYPQRLESVGFKIEPFDIKQHLSPAEIERYRLDKEEILFVAKKV